MSKSKSNSISKDFPLYHSNLIPIFHTEKIIPKGKKIISSNTYTNEHPDFLKLECMKEKGYQNPYLNDLIKIDRSEQFKKMEKNKRRLELINYLKSDRKNSQDPSKLKYIQSEFDIEMYKKRKNIYENNYNTEINNQNKYLVTEPNDSNYNKILSELNFFTPKAHYQNIKYRIKGNNLENMEKIKKIKCDFEPRKSAYLSNCNDYKIWEANQRDKNKEFIFKRKDFMKVNIITGKKEEIKLPDERNERWGKFYENFFLIMNNKNGFRKKGGLFTEFSNKNIGSININKANSIKKINNSKNKK